MKLKETAVGVEAIVIPKGPGQAELELNGAYIDESDEKGVNFFFKKLSGEKIAQATLIPFEHNSVSCRFLLNSDVCNALALDGQNVYNLSADGIAGEIRFQVQGRLAIYSEASERANSATQEPLQSEIQTTSKVDEIRPEPKKGSVSKDTSSKKSLNKLILGIALAILFILVALAVWYFLSKDTTQGTQEAINSSQVQITQEKAKEQETTTNKNLQAVSSKANYSKCDLRSESNDQSFIKACLSTNPSADLLLTTAQQAFEEGRCDLGIRLYSSLGRSGDEKASRTYAQYLDPNNNLSSSCVKKDATQANYWYEKAQKNSPSK